MAKYTFVVLTNPVEGKEDEYNKWYNQHHIPDVISVPGFVSGHRFRLADTQFGGEASRAFKYLALYEIETDDLPALSARFQKELSSFHRALNRDDSGNIMAIQISGDD